MILWSQIQTTFNTTVTTTSTNILYLLYCIHTLI